MTLLSQTVAIIIHKAYQTFCYWTFPPYIYPPPQELSSQMGKGLKTVNPLPPASVIANKNTDMSGFIRLCFGGKTNNIFCVHSRHSLLSPFFVPVAIWQNKKDNKYLFCNFKQVQRATSSSKRGTDLYWWQSGFN